MWTEACYFEVLVPHLGLLLSGVAGSKECRMASNPGLQLLAHPVSLELLVEKLDHVDPRGPLLCGLNKPQPLFGSPVVTEGFPVQVSQLLLE